MDTTGHFEVLRRLQKNTNSLVRIEGFGFNLENSTIVLKLARKGYVKLQNLKKDNKIKYLQYVITPRIIAEEQN